MSINLNLTPAERREAWLHLSNILSMLPIAKATGKLQDEFLNLERKLAAELIGQWRETYTEALKEIFKSIPDFAAEGATKLLQDLLLDALGTAFGSSKNVRDFVSKRLTQAYSSSKSKWAMPKLKDKDVKSVLLSLADKKAISVLTRHNCFWIGQHYGNHVSPKIADITQRALDEGMGRDALAEELRQELGSVGPKGYTYWDVVASSAIVRARSFGTISGMEEAGITEYEVLAMGDERMCPICGELNGQVFSVAETRKVINKALDLKDPEAFKEALPWHTKPPIGKNAAKLTADGQSIPPFHGRCRCTLIMGESTIDAPEDEIRGVTQEQIWKLRGTRGHDEANSLKVEDIQKDYERVGIKCSFREAKDIRDSVREYSTENFSDMRQAFMRRKFGETPMDEDHDLLVAYDHAQEYVKVAPTYKGQGAELYRGIKNDGKDYAQYLLSLEPKNQFDLERASSFSSTIECADEYAGDGGIMLHIKDTNIRNAVSIKGISASPEEDEVLVGDRIWQVVKVADEEDGRHHIYLER